MQLRTAVLLCAFAAGVSTTAPARATPPIDHALADRLDAEEQALRPQRLALRTHFKAAYARYPAIPAGTLEAIAYVQSRWMHLAPDATRVDTHHHMPAAYGAMGLYAGDGFADQIGEASRLLGVPAARIKTDPRTNVLAAAALLDRELRRDVSLKGVARATPEAIRPALMRYAGFDIATADTQVGDYARSSFAYDVLLAQDRGVTDRGIVVPERAIAWERAFPMQELIQLRAPMLRLDAARDRIEVGGVAIDPRSETLRTTPSHTGPDVGIQSTDYGPALWSASPYFGTRSSYSSTTIHTAQGSYAGTINWFKSNPYSVSAHYVIRSSDGQVTQMVRNANSAHHVGVHNATTLGIEHEGFVDNSSWYTTAMYNASAALVRNFCSKYSAITCANAYKGPAHRDVVVLPTSVDIKGHQHYTQQDHNDPGIHWDWARYYALLNPGSGGGGTRILDSFESSVGHYNTPVTYSGSTVGVSTASDKTRDCATAKNGTCALRLLLKDNPSSAANWEVRLLSHSGDPASNIALTKGGGRIGAWIYAGATGISVAAAIDDSDGTERSVARAIPANTWTYVSWQLDLSADWNAWSGGDGTITAATVKLDALWIFHANTAYDINVYVDDVQTSN